MTVEAETAVDIGYKLEMKKDALRQTQDGGVKVTFTIHPQDMPAQLYSDPMGQRFIAVLVPISDDETPRIPVLTDASDKDGDTPAADGLPTTPHKGEAAKAGSQQPETKSWNQMSYAQRAGILCSDPTFHDFLKHDYVEIWLKVYEIFSDWEYVSAEMVRKICMVNSRSEIMSNSGAGKRFDDLNSQYRMYLKYENHHIGGVK